MVASRASELTRHFFWRFFENDLVSPDADIHETASFLLAFLVAPCVLEVPGLAFNYGNSFTPPLERIGMIVGDQFGYVSWSMLVAALVATLVWDAFALDARDHAVLGPLPIAPREMIAAKLRATGAFLLALVVCANGVSAVAFALLAPGPSSTLGAALSLLFGHVVACAAAALFGFFVVLALRGLFANLLGPRLFARIGLALQFLIALACVVGYLAWSAQSLENGAWAIYLSPPLWFLALYQSLGPHVIPGVAVPHAALFGRLAPWAAVAVGVSALVGISTYFLAYFRFAQHKPQAFASGGRALRTVLRGPALVARSLLRDPLGRAMFFFTGQTLGRSSRHRLYLAGYLLGGCVLSYLTVVPLTSERAPVRLATPSPQLLAVQAILVLALLGGIRAAILTPTELRAAWLFRLTAGGNVDTRRYAAGIRRATFSCFAVPLLLLMLPLQSALWGTRYAAQHLALGTLWALVLNEFLLLHLTKLPFTCARVHGKNRLLFRWPAYVAGVGLYGYGFAHVEYWALGTGKARELAIALVTCYAMLVAYRHLRARRLGSFVFDEAPDGATTLGL